MESKKQIRNLVLFAIAALLVLGIFTGSSLPSLNSGTPETQKYIAEHVVTMDGDKLRTAVKQNGPTLLFVYASWCPYCKKQIGEFAQLQRQRGGEPLQIIYASLDSDIHALATFMMQQHPNADFTPYHVQNGYSFGNALKEYGFTPDGGVPHLMLFGKDGKPITEFKGLQRASAIQAAFDKAS